MIHGFHFQEERRSEIFLPFLFQVQMDPLDRNHKCLNLSNFESALNNH